MDLVARAGTLVTLVQPVTLVTLVQTELQEMAGQLVTQVRGAEEHRLHHGVGIPQVVTEVTRVVAEAALSHSRH